MAKMWFMLVMLVVTLTCANSIADQPKQVSLSIHATASDEGVEGTVEITAGINSDAENVASGNKTEDDGMSLSIQGKGSDEGVEGTLEVTGAANSDSEDDTAEGSNIIDDQKLEDLSEEMVEFRREWKESNQDIVDQLQAIQATFNASTGSDGDNEGSCTNRTSSTDSGDTSKLEAREARIEAREARIEALLSKIENGFSTSRCTVPDLKNGSSIPAVGEIVNHSDEIIFTCDSNFSSPDAMTRTCEHGNFIPAITVGSDPKCYLGCTVPDLKNGSSIPAVGEIVNHGDQIIFSCDSNFSLPDAMNKTCDQGNFIPEFTSGSDAKCYSDCMVPTIANLKTPPSGWTVKHGEVVSTFACDTNYSAGCGQLINRTCNDGEWSPSFETIELVCGPSYTFRATTRRLTFYQARSDCIGLGGDLIMNNLGPSGVKYHDEIRQIVWGYTSPGTYEGMWIGYTKSGSWRFLNGDYYDAYNHGQAAAAYWSSGEPNNSGSAAKIWRHPGSFGLDDCRFGESNYGLCEIKRSNCP